MTLGVVGAPVEFGLRTGSGLPFWSHYQSKRWDEAGQKFGLRGHHAEYGCCSAPTWVEAPKVRWS
jgi:hypothetical protein